MRKGRLNANNFGINAERVTPSLIKHLLGEYDISRVKAVAWGVTNEAEVIETFTAKVILKLLRRGCGLTSQVFLELPLMD